MRRILNFDYSAIQGTYWMYYGVIASFASVFLLEKGYTNAAIGGIFAIGSVVAIFLQPFAADIADNTKKSSLIGITAIMTGALAVATLGMFAFGERAAALSAVYVFLVGWHTAIQPLVNSLSFKLQDTGYRINFGVARSVGSLAYAALVAVLGFIVVEYGVMAIPVVGEGILIIMLVMLLVAHLHFKKASTLDDPEKDNALTYLSESGSKIESISLKDFVKRNKVFVIVNLGIIGLYFSNAVLNNFMIQIVTNVGGDSADMGTLLSIMAALEIPTMIFFERIRKRFKCQTLIKVASVFFVVKIGLCLMAKSVMMLTFAMITQLFSFALLLPAMVHFINEIMDRREAVKGQAVYTMMTTVGAVLSSLVGGWILDQQGAGMLLLVSTIVTAIGAVVIVFTIDKVKSRREF